MMAAAKNLFLHKQWHHLISTRQSHCLAAQNFSNIQPRQENPHRRGNSTLQHCSMCLRASASLVPTQFRCTQVRHCSTKSVLDTQPESWLYTHPQKNMAKNIPLRLDLEKKLAGESLDSMRRNLNARKMEADLDALVNNFALMSEVGKKKQEWDSKISEVENQLEVLKTQEEFSEENEDFKNLTIKLSNLHKSVKAEIDRKEFFDLEEKVYHPALRLPNDLHFDTPLSKEPLILKEKKGTREPQRVNHIEAGEMHDLIKFSQVGPKAYYLKGELAIAEIALSDLVSDYLKKKGYKIFTGPEFYRSPLMEACGRDIHNTEEVLSLHYMIKKRVEPLVHLAGVSHMSLAAYAAGLDFAEAMLPFNLYTCSKTYQKSDLPGLYGATQSTQVGMYSCVTEAQVDQQFEAMTQHVWNLLGSLGFSMRLTLVPAPALRCEERRRVELQVYAPSLDTFIPIGQVSDLGDYASRRLMTSYRDFHHLMKSESTPIHMISGTAVNITSLLAAWVEHTDLENMGFSL